MVAKTSGEKISLFLGDLKNSLFFKIWTITWLISAIVAFVAFIILSHISEQSKTHSEFIDRLIPEKSINFPKITFRLPPRENNSLFNIENPACHFGEGGKVIVKSEPCSYENITKCIIFRGDEISAVADKEHSDYNKVDVNHIVCNLKITGLFPNNESTVISLILDNQPAILIEPRDALIQLQKNKINYQDFEGDYFTHSVNYFLPIANIIFDGSLFTVIFTMDSFNVNHFNQVDIWDTVGGYNGWIAAGYIGGFAFFVYIIHTIFMFFIGFCIANDSQFLRNSE